MSDVPFPPVLEDILLRLPVKSLLQHGSVSKSLCALIDSPYFVNIHMQKSMKTNKVLYFSGDSRFSVSLRNQSVVLLETPFEISAFPVVLGSSHGLICLSNGPDDRSVLLWYPSTTKYKQIPRSIYEPLGDKDITTYDQLGYDHVSDDYKVVRLSHFTSSSMANAWVVSISAHSSLMKLYELNHRKLFDILETINLNI